MQFGVNLLPRKDSSPVQQEALGRIKRWLILALGLYVVFMTVLFSIFFYLSITRKQIEAESKQIETKIKSLEKRESLALTLKKRMEVVSPLIAAREEKRKKGVSHEQLLAWIQSLAVAGVSFGDASLAPSEVSFTGEAQNAFSLDEFLRQFNNKADKFNLVVLDGLSRSSKGVYSFSLKAK